MADSTVVRLYRLDKNSDREQRIIVETIDKVLEYPYCFKIALSRDIGIINFMTKNNKDDETMTFVRMYFDILEIHDIPSEEFETDDSDKENDVSNDDILEDDVEYRIDDDDYPDISGIKGIEIVRIRRKDE